MRVYWSTWEQAAGSILFLDLGLPCLEGHGDLRGIKLPCLEGHRDLVGFKGG